MDGCTELFHAAFCQKLCMDGCTELFHAAFCQKLLSERNTPMSCQLFHGIESFGWITRSKEWNMIRLKKRHVVIKTISEAVN